MFLEVTDLHTYYGMSHVLNGISLTVDTGEIVSLIGRNGMGKSTTLKSIIGLAKPKSGSVLFDGKDIAGYPPYKVAQAGIGYVPEDRRIFPNLSVLDNLSLGIKGSQDGKRWTVHQVFHYFPQLKERLYSMGSHLSGGEQQMLAIGRALMGNPRLLLVDEPTEGLAPLMIKAVKEVLAKVNQAGVAILLVEHNIDVALSLAHRVYVMGKGHVGFSGTGDEFESRPEIREMYLEV